jgi:type II secretory pathway pseudopilin PulG
MSSTMRRRRSLGFTLLEVLLATGIMAVGTTSVLVVIATAAGLASQRQVNLRREQVLDEARHEAQAMVDAFRPGKAAAAPAAASKTKAGQKAAAEAAAKLAPEKVVGKQSTRFGGFVYDIDFSPVDRQVPEKGFDVAVTVHYGDGLSVSSESTMITSTIAEDEFETSSTWEAERLGGSEEKKKAGATKK